MSEKKLAPGLVRHGKQRTEGVIRRIDAAKKRIECELDDNEGIYPFNGGRLNEAEVCRRAKVSNVTLSRPSHIETTKAVLSTWLKEMAKVTLTGRGSVRKAVTARVDDWKMMHAQIVQSYHLAELELEEMRRRVVALEQSNAALVALLKDANQTKVAALLPRAK